tara:strand:+ start:143922 stop:145901 length:1980 start_codon:yes stop_codon:yes gene_type:complete
MDNSADNSRAWPSLGYRPDIQGLRALAVILVIVFHVDLPLLSGGYIGVDVFFVISGFLISGLLFRELAKEGRIQFGRFYARRARRLLPVAALVLVVTLLASMWLLSPLENKELGKTALFTSLFSSNIWFIFEAADYFGSNIENNALLHTWSLGVEEQFYFIWPALLSIIFLVSSKRAVWKWGLLLVSLSSLLLFFILYTRNQPIAFFSMPTRAWQFGCGALLYFLPVPLKARQSILAGVAGLLLIVGTAILIGPNFDSQALWAVPPTLGTCLVIWAGQGKHRNYITSLLALRPLQYIGALSYSLYLWHWPVIVFSKIEFGLLGPPEVLFALVTTFILSILSFHFVETQWRQHPAIKSISASLLFGGGLIIAGSVAAFSVYLYSKSALLSPGQMEIDATSFGSKETKGCSSELESSKLVECTLGALGGEVEIVVIGDSKAMQWLPVISEMGKDHGWRITSLIKDACPPAVIEPYISKIGRHYGECSIWRTAALTRLIDISPDLVFVTHWPGYTIAENGGYRKSNFEDWQAGYAELSNILYDLDTRVLLLRDNPQFPIDIPICLSRAAGTSKLSPTMCRFDIHEIENSDAVYRAAQSVFESHDRVKLADLTAQHCKQDFCESYAGGIVRLTDRHHLSFLYTKQLAHILEEEITNTLNRSLH